MLLSIESTSSASSNSNSAEVQPKRNGQKPRDAADQGKRAQAEAANRRNAKGGSSELPSRSDPVLTPSKPHTIGPVARIRCGGALPPTLLPRSPGATRGRSRSPQLSHQVHTVLSRPHNVMDVLKVKHRSGMLSNRLPGGSGAVAGARKMGVARTVSPELEISQRLKPGWDTTSRSSIQRTTRRIR
jgi:hypothetical protein